MHSLRVVEDGGALLKDLRPEVLPFSASDHQALRHSSSAQSEMPISQYGKQGRPRWQQDLRFHFPR